MVDGAGHGKAADAAGPAVAETLVPGVATPSDQRGEREAFDVLDQRRPAANTAFEGPRRCRGRPGTARVHEVYGSRFLARHVASRRLDDAGPPAHAGGGRPPRGPHARLPRPW